VYRSTIAPPYNRASLASAPPLIAAQTADVAGLKRVIYDGFLAALAAALPRRIAGILSDQQFGAAILPGAAAVPPTAATCAEKGGEAEI
jgi:hypothetical protein